MAISIVVGYDGSDGAKAALDEGVELARKLSAKLLVAYAYGGPRSYAGAPLTPRATLKELGEKLLDEARARVAGSGVATEQILVDENAAEGLQSVARRHSAEMIIVGTHGESPISGFLLGSTAYKLVHTTTTPVMVVPTAERQQKAA